MNCTNATPVTAVAVGYFNRPVCPRCGEEQYAPELSQFAGDNRVSHCWSCDECGHQFCTSVAFGDIEGDDIAS